jgi:hypothetical protein
LQDVSNLRAAMYPAICQPTAEAVVPRGCQPFV